MNKSFDTTRSSGALGAQCSCEEWLEVNGLGGYACGAGNLIPRRKYHALMCLAEHPPHERVVILSQAEVWIDSDTGTYALSAFLYSGEVVWPNGQELLKRFLPSPWPTWEFLLPDGTTIVQELFYRQHTDRMFLSWRRLTGGVPMAPARIRVRPLLACRDQHALHVENDQFSFQPLAMSEQSALFVPYSCRWGIKLSTNAKIRREQLWYRNILYSSERERGYDYLESLACPAEISGTLLREERVVVMCEAGPGDYLKSKAVGLSAAEQFTIDSQLELERRAAAPDPFFKAAAAFVVRGDHNSTIMAGYPWFSSWGRDTFISLRGLKYSFGKGGDTLVREILRAWGAQISAGMVPNRFIEVGEASVEYNSIDAALWFALVALESVGAFVPGNNTPADESALEAVREIVSGYLQGTRYKIGVTDDGLVRGGEPGVQLTWMDAKIGDHVVTPRIGKPVEVNALWINVLLGLSKFDSTYRARFELAERSFIERFWNHERNALYDVVDCDHQSAAVDARIRPNQIYAVGGLPHQILRGERAALVLAIVERELLTPFGLRSLARGEQGYSSCYSGNQVARDHAYHQGIVWPYFIGPFVEAWLRVHGMTAQARSEAKLKFIAPMEQALKERFGGHIPELTDAEPPFAFRGAPFQAWSLGEFLRARELVSYSN